MASWSCLRFSEFVEKDSKLSDTVNRGLLKCSLRPIVLRNLFGEPEEVLEATQAAEFQKCG
ncbi:unnamed protein product [Eruca vesicaria subsp. sativa]|uniref:Uncharacterized protein n=1 Tax=Eruca vesicaria subsp. sativa TaxID=29727 RepID=A0ABC8M8S0_ERUVS|nr:unnamed protein product [Eruca vesicaria subsp. sativa]